jgi:predicted signal transduction protein with EAL and GGDEF domain
LVVKRLAAKAALHRGREHSRPISSGAQPAVSAAWRKTRLAKAAGCNRFQGYFFGRPAPRDKVGLLRAANTEPLALSA